MNPLDHVRAFTSFSFISLNLLFWSIPLLIVGLVKAFIAPGQNWARSQMDRIYYGAVSFHDWWLRRVLQLKWDKPEIDLDSTKTFIIVANHQSWADILVIQSVITNSQASIGPIVKMLAKQELMWVPVLGLVIWAYDFPKLRRSQRIHLSESERRQADRERIAQACAILKRTPAAMLTFAEGTRFTSDKHSSADSQYEHLLPPKPGGFAVICEALQSDEVDVIDVTLAYPKEVSFWRFLAGKCPPIRVDVQQFTSTEVVKQGTTEWLNQRWQIKNEMLREPS